MAMKASSRNESKFLSEESSPQRDELICWDPKDCDLCLNWLKPEETLVEDLVTMLTCKSLVRVEHSGERPIEQSGSWFPPKFPLG